MQPNHNHLFLQLTHPKFEQGNSKYLAAVVNKLKDKKIITDDVVFGKYDASFFSFLSY